MQDSLGRRVTMGDVKNLMETASAKGIKWTEETPLSDLWTDVHGAACNLGESRLMVISSAPGLQAILAADSVERAWATSVPKDALCLPLGPLLQSESVRRLLLDLGFSLRAVEQDQGRSRKQPGKLIVIPLGKQHEPTAGSDREDTVRIRYTGRQYTHRHKALSPEYDFWFLEPSGRDGADLEHPEVVVLVVEWLWQHAPTITLLHFDWNNPRVGPLVYT